MSRRTQLRTVTAILAAGLVAAGGSALATGTSGTRSGAGHPASAAASCSHVHTPGTTAGGPTPADLIAEYGVLARPRHAADALSGSGLTGLTASGILVGGARFLAALPYHGRAFIVPAQHLLAFPLGPLACLPPQDRGVEPGLVAKLRAEYAQEAVCLVVVYPTQDAGTCEAAPGTVDPLLAGLGTPGFGLVPDGVAQVSVGLTQTHSRRVRARDNFWAVLDDRQASSTACGVSWLDGRGVVLRIVKPCTPDVS